MTAKKTILAAIMIASLVAALALFGCSPGSTKQLTNDNVTKAVNTYIGKMELENSFKAKYSVSISTAGWAFTDSDIAIASGGQQATVSVSGEYTGLDASGATVKGKAKAVVSVSLSGGTIQCSVASIEKA